MNLIKLWFYKLKLLLLTTTIVFISFFVFLSIKLVNFKSLISFFTNSNTNNTLPLNDKEFITLTRITQAIGIAINIVPWRLKCYESALILLLFSRLFGINLTINFGINKNDVNHITAHAWTSVGNIVFTGKEEMPEFTLLYSQSYLPLK